MRTMGLSQFIQWIAHLIINYTKILIVVIVTAVLMYFVAKQTDFSILLLFFALYAYNATYYSFLISTFCNSGNAGTLMAIVGWIFLYFWSSYFAGIDMREHYSYETRMINCINPNVAMYLGLQMIAQYETQGLIN